MKKQVVLNWILSMGILVPLITSLRAYFSISLNILYILAIILVFFLHIVVFGNISITANNRTLLKVIVFCVCCSYVYYCNQKGSLGVVLYGSISMVIPFVMNSKTMEILRKLIFFLTVVSLMCYVLYLANFSWIHTASFNWDDRFYALHGLCLSEFKTVDYSMLASLRFYGFSNEPGAFGVLMLFMLLIGEFKFDFSNMIFFIAGFFTFSTSFYMLIMIAFLLTNFRFYGLKFQMKKIYRFIYFVIPIVFVFISVVLTLGKSFMTYLGDFFWIKFIYLFSDWEKFEIRFFPALSYIEKHGISFFGNFSFLNFSDSGMFSVLLFSGIIGGILYMMAIGCFPKKYWLIFIALGFYRSHFIYNSIPFLVLFISHENLIKNNGNIDISHIKYRIASTHNKMDKKRVKNSCFLKIPYPQSSLV